MNKKKDVEKRLFFIVKKGGGLKGKSKIRKSHKIS